ncbi:exo-alpha-sialidase [Hungatella sp.]|uniref:exo-alpha-sialidase n=1 Tax=Hungatella sp. TaxID=2613924 RepID=UPI002A84193E|nr:exo-alpha-sialidase [Hungatella sp.]
MKKIWTSRQAWDWYGKKTWIVGCNYVPSCSINGIATWQEEGFDQVYDVMKRELSLAAEIGMNSVRMGLPFPVWRDQHDGFMDRLERVLNLLENYHMTMMPVFFDDCGRGPVEYYSPQVQYGTQPEPVPGMHGGYKAAPPIQSSNPTYSMVDEKENWPEMERFVRDIVGQYAKDDRILMWDIWNEPGNSGSAGVGGIDKSIRPMELAFGWAREMEPEQPLTAGCWDYYIDRVEHGRFKPLTPIEQRALELSDVISFHYYGSLENTRKIVECLKKWNRPLFITEWLHRPFGNEVRDLLPYYKEEKIGCYCWGLVNGKNQTHEPWDWIRDWKLDFSRWQHDLFYGDLTPYNETEIEVFKRTAGQELKCAKKQLAGGDRMNSGTVKWDKPAVIHNMPYFEDAGIDARLLHPGMFGSQYPRMVILKDGTWLVVYTVYDNNGYLADPAGGTCLEFAKSSDQGKNWTKVSRLSHPARDLDNGQMILAKNGDILLCCRSVRWQESYQLPVYRSGNGGKSWEFYSILDERNGAPGSLGNPDKGMYEPHFYRLADGRLSVMYANEVHVTERPYYSQIISQKISEDDGSTWGQEIWVAWDASNPQYRPGMPVWMRMQDGRYIVVFEVVRLVLTQLESADIYYKISEDGIHWEEGIGTRIPEQSGGPFIEQQNSGRLLVTSLSGNISYSDDNAETWKVASPAPFETFIWPCVYALSGDRILLLNSCTRENGGENIQVRIGEFERPKEEKKEDKEVKEERQERRS